MTLSMLEDGDEGSAEVALWSIARARHHREAAEFERIPLEGPIEGVRAVLTGHAIFHTPTRSANVWHLDTGAGIPNGALTIAQIDCDPIQTGTMPTL